MKHTALRKYLLLVSVSIFSCSTGAEAGKLDNLDWDSEKIVTKPARFIPSQGNKNSREFNGGARCFIEKIDFFDEDVQDLPLERGRFIANQDADHPDSLRSLSVWDTEKNLMYTKEEVLGKQGKKIIYCDHQADVSYWKKKGRWYVVAPYAFGYYKEQYTSRKALEERLEGLFQQRVINYPSKFYEVSLQEKDHFIIKKFEGWVFKKVLETKKASNIQEVHQFFLDRERKRYTDYLYEGEEAPSKLKSLGLATLLIGAGVVDGPVVESLVAKPLNVMRLDRSRCQGQYLGVVEQCVLPRRESGRRTRRGLQSGHDGVLRAGGEVRFRQDHTETRSVMVHSIVAAIQCRDADADELTLAAAERPGAMHHLFVQLPVLAHHCGMHGMHLDDVVGVGDTIRFGECVGGDVADERHDGLAVCHRRAPRIRASRPEGVRATWAVRFSRPSAVMRTTSSVNTLIPRVWS